MKNIKSLSLKKSNKQVSQLKTENLRLKTKVLSFQFPNIRNKSIICDVQNKNIYEKKPRLDTIQTPISTNLKKDPQKYPLKINSCKKPGLMQFCFLKQLFKKLQEEKIFIQKLKAIFQKGFHQNFQQFYQFFYKATLQIIQLKKQEQLLKSTSDSKKCFFQSQNNMSSQKEKNTSLNDLNNIPVMKKLQMLEDPFKGTFNINYDPFGFSYQDFFLKEFKNNLSFQMFKINDEDAKFMRNGVVQCMQLYQDVFAQIAIIQQSYNQTKLFREDQLRKSISKIIKNIKIKVEDLQKNMKMQYTIFQETRGKINQLRYQLMV